MEDIVISIQNAEVSFKKFKLGPVNIDIPRGYIIGVQGENGAGKSTFLRMLMGNYKDMTGSVLLDGKDVRDNKEYTFNSIGYISDKRAFFEMEDAFGNEAYYSDFYNAWDKERYRKLLNTLNVPKTTGIGKLSKGERVKFQLAFCAAYNPEVMLLDEPTAGLDPVFRDDFLKTLQELVAEYETTILLATHLDEDLNKIADYIIDIDNGCCRMREV